MSDDPRRWPRVDPRDPGVPPERQDRKVYPVPLAWTLYAAILRDRTSARDLVYNR